MKIHRPIVSIVIQALQHTFAEGYYADKVIDRLFRNNRQLGARDRRFIAETVYEIVRWWRYLWACLGETPATDETALFRLVGAWLVLQGHELPPWGELKGLDANQIRANAQAAKSQPAVRESVPDWLYELGRRELGEKWDDALAALNRPAPVVLRANTLKTNAAQLARLLDEQGVDAVPAIGTSDGLLLKERKNVFQTEAFKQGLFEVQDGASQQVVPMLDVRPGLRVIDACAGAGGKSLHIAALLKNKGKLISMDVHERKLEELRKRASRAGVDVIETKLIDSSKVLKRLEGAADRLLLDVPCSGIGVLRRNPDSKWKLSAEEISRLHALQREILGSYWKMLKPGGRMVYATCSILPSENEDQVNWFLQENPGKWRLLEQRRFWPGQEQFDGFFAASLERLA